MFQNIEIKLNSRTCLTLKSSVVIFEALEPLQPQWPLQPQQPQWPQWPQQPHFIKKFTNPYDLMIPGSKMTNTGPFLWNGSSKIQFFTDFNTFSVRGCWGQPMLLFWKLIRETEISKPPEASRHYNSTKLLVILTLRADLLCTLHYETPCNTSMLLRNYLTHILSLP